MTTDSTDPYDSISPVSTVPGEEATRDAPVPTDSVIPDRAAPSAGAVHPKPGSGKKWFLTILIGLILVFGLIAAAYYFSHDEQRGVTVIRMEGTMVTGQVSDADSIGSEVVGRETAQCC